MNLIRLGLNSSSKSLLFFEAAILNNYCDKKRFIIPILHSSMSGELNSTIFSSTPKHLGKYYLSTFQGELKLKGLGLQKHWKKGMSRPFSYCAFLSIYVTFGGPAIRLVLRLFFVAVLRLKLSLQV